MNVLWDTINNGLHLTIKMLDSFYLAFIILFFSAILTISMNYSIKSIEIIMSISILLAFIIPVLTERNLGVGFVIGIVQMLLIIFIYICGITISTYPNSIRTVYYVFSIILGISFFLIFSIIKWKKNK